MSINDFSIVNGQPVLPTQTYDSSKTIFINSTIMESLMEYYTIIYFKLQSYQQTFRSSGYSLSYLYLNKWLQKITQYGVMSHFYTYTVS